MKNIFIVLLIYSCFIFGCHPKQKKLSYQDMAQHQENLIRANKYLLSVDAEKIKAYAKRRNWNMKVTDSGLWYYIYEHGTGKQALSGKLAIFSYKSWLLDGTLCYSSDSLGPKQFRIGKGGIESGLEEGVLLLHEGDKAKFILPPHLAFGIPGDGIKIPRRSILVYDILLTQISD